MVLATDFAAKYAAPSVTAHIRGLCVYGICRRINVSIIM